MPISNYPNGYADGFTVRNIPIAFSSARKVFYVNNSSSLADGGVAGVDQAGQGTYQRPFSTIDFAIGECQANSGDIIACMPGHAETVSGASGITGDVDGVSLIALGNGADRATLTFSATASTFVISAASFTFENFIVTPSIDAVVSPIVVSGADCWLDYEHRDASSAIEAERAVLTTATADRINIRLKYVGFTAGNATVNAVRLVGTDTGSVHVDFFGVASTSVVEFVTTACSNIDVTGNFFNSGTTDGSKDVIDTITGSTWYAVIEDSAAGAKFTGGSASALASDDVSVIAANQTVPSADSTANTLERDVVGNKTDASVYVPGTTKSIAAYTKGLSDLQVSVALSATAVMVDNDTIFTIAGGPINILALWSECVTANDGTASTIVYKCTPTTGSEQTISAATASIASAGAGDSIALIGTALSTAAVYNANGPNLGMTAPVTAPIGTIDIDVAIGSTTGTWRHFLRYEPIAKGVTVT